MDPDPREFKKRRTVSYDVTAAGSARSKTKSRRQVAARRSYKVSARGYTPDYRFHRWITAFGAGVNVTDCTYNTSTSTIEQNVSTASSLFSLYFQLADLPSVSEFSTLFDQYQITGVLVQIKMINNPDQNYVPGSGVTANVTNYYPTIWYAPDFDDNNNTSLAAIKEFDKVKHRVLKPNQELNIFVKPKTLGLVYRPGVTSAYSTQFQNQWIDMANTDVPYYGLKMVFDNEGITGSSTVGLNYKYKINAKYYLRMKNVR